MRENVWGYNRVEWEGGVSRNTVRNWERKALSKLPYICFLSSYCNSQNWTWAHPRIPEQFQYKSISVHFFSIFLWYLTVGCVIISFVEVGHDKYLRSNFRVILTSQSYVLDLHCWECTGLAHTYLSLILCIQIVLHY